MTRTMVVIVTVAIVAVGLALALWLGGYEWSRLSHHSSWREWGVLAGRLVLALGLSMAIGHEREAHDKPAGMRTVTMVGVGSCLFALLAGGWFAPGSDAMSRVIQGVITGIGFLGAGTIIKQKFQVEGLTTAATIWAAAGVGMAVGVGEYALALIGTGAVLAVLVVLGHIEDHFRRRYQLSRKRHDATLETDDDVDD